MSAEELLPCPFCGTAMQLDYDDKSEMYGPGGDHLPGCIIGNWDMREYAYKPDAEAAWNSRARQPSNITCQLDDLQPVSNPYKFDATQPLSSPQRFDAEIAWLKEAARYFSNRPTGGEDAAHWSNVYNAENANKIASRLDALISAHPPQPDALPGDLRERIEVAAEWLAMAIKAEPPINASIPYVPICQSELEAIATILDLIQSERAG
jgi:hypothetical protein